MSIRDRNIDWLRQKHYIHADRFGFCATPASAVFGAGSPIPTQVSDVGWGGLLIAAAGDTAAAPDFQTPCIADPTEEIGVRVIWSIHAAGTATTDDVTWLVKYDQFDIGEVPVVVVVFSGDARTIERELRSMAQQKLAASQRPMKYFFREQLPLTSSGKVDKRSLREELNGLNLDLSSKLRALQNAQGQE